MMETIKKIQHLFSYWYLRYLLATELYTLEPWEKVVIHVVLVLVFALFWYFNYSIMMSSIATLRGATQLQPVI